MTTVFTLRFSGQSIDNLLQFSYSEKAKKGEGMHRKRYIDAPHQELRNATLNGNPNLPRAAMQLVLTSGSCSIEYEWTEDENITQDDLDQYETYLKSEINSYNIVKDLENKKFNLSYTYNGDFNEWSDPPIGYVLKTPIAKFTIEEDDSDLLCVIRTADILDWSVRQIDIPASTTKTIDKPDCELCYIVFSKEVSTGSSVLEKWSTKKMTSNSLDITNNKETPCKVIQYYK